MNKSKLEKEKCPKLKEELIKKERSKIEIQNKINKLEEELQTLNTEIIKIRNKKNNKFHRAFSYLIYNIVIEIVIITFTACLINKLAITSGLLKKLYILNTYLGITTLSTLGAFVSSKIEEKFQRKINTKSMELIRKIETQYQEIEKEKSMKKLIEKDISCILSEIEILTESSNKIPTTNNRITEYSRPYTKIRKKKM